jgi:putative PIN family toxin of toxin-antitoxin system
VIDANTVISAALSPAGVLRRVLAAARLHGTVALSEAVYLEIAEVLASPKFARVLTEDRQREVLELLNAAAIWVRPAVTVHDCRNGKDDCYLELALTAAAKTIVTGDEDLLVLHPWRGIQILRPVAFLAALGADQPQS